MMILALEAMSLIATAALAVLWALNPDGNFEPYTILAGVIFGWAELLRRKSGAKSSVEEPPAGSGGRGGSAKVGGNGVAIGGIGGRGGISGGGSGGDGGSAEVSGDGFAMGGEGGEAGQADRGGRGGRSPLEVLGVPNQQLPDGRWLWDLGRGGDGAPLIHPDEELEDKERK